MAKFFVTVIRVDEICKAIYQSNELLENIMKLLNENNTSKFSRNEHTFTIIEKQQQQLQQNSHQDRISMLSPIKVIGSSQKSTNNSNNNNTRTKNNTTSSRARNIINDDDNEKKIISEKQNRFVHI